MFTLSCPLGLPSTEETLTPESSPRSRSAGPVATDFTVPSVSVTISPAASCTAIKDRRQITARILLGFIALIVVSYYCVIEISYHTVLYSGAILSTASPLSFFFTGTSIMRFPSGSKAWHISLSPSPSKTISASIPSHSIGAVPSFPP